MPRRGERCLRMLGLAWVGAAMCAAQAADKVDRFGGFRAIKLESTGWFRVAQAGERSFLVTPEGHAFVALGVNHAGALDRGAAAWERRREALVEQLRGWNMDNLGYGGPPELERTLPYFAAITLARVEKHRSDPVAGRPDSYVFPDVFDPAWQKAVESEIENGCARHRENPFLIGYFWTDTPTWDVVKTRGLRGTDWVSEIRKLPAKAPGRRRYAEFLAKRYDGRLADLNTIYGLELNSLEALATADLSRVAIGRHVAGEDDRAFLGEIARQFYETAGTAQRKCDPNHLVFGDRYLAGDAPANVLKVAAPHIDSVSVQPGDRYTKQYPPSTRFPERVIERLHRLTRKPVLICDHAISFPVPGQPKTIFEQMPTQEEAARATEAFVRQAYAKTYMLGYLRCQYVDRPAGFGRGLRQGLVDAEGRPYEAMTAAYRRVFGEWVEMLVRSLTGSPRI